MSKKTAAPEVTTDWFQCRKELTKLCQAVRRVEEAVGRQQLLLLDILPEGVSDMEDTDNSEEVP